METYTLINLILHVTYTCKATCLNHAKELAFLATNDLCANGDNSPEYWSQH